MSEPLQEPFKLVGLVGGVWAVPGVDEQPVVRLECWQVFELDNGDTHLVGWHEDNREGRVSTRLMAFDAVRRQGLTASGRVYELCGGEGCNGDARYVWETWLRARDRDATDVTPEFVRCLEDARQ